MENEKCYSLSITCGISLCSCRVAMSDVVANLRCGYLHVCSAGLELWLLSLRQFRKVNFAVATVHGLRKSHRRSSFLSKRLVNPLHLLDRSKRVNCHSRTKATIIREAKIQPPRVNRGRGLSRSSLDRYCQGLPQPRKSFHMFLEKLG